MGDKKFFDLAAIEQCRMLIEAQCSVCGSMMSKKVTTYCLVNCRMIEHRLCEVGVKDGQREVEVVRHGESGAPRYRWVCPVT
jgi:hypothetical protein